MHDYLAGMLAFVQQQNKEVLERISSTPEDQGNLKQELEGLLGSHREH